MYIIEIKGKKVHHNNDVYRFSTIEEAQNMADICYGLSFADVIDEDTGQVILLLSDFM